MFKKSFFAILICNACANAYEHYQRDEMQDRRIDIMLALRLLATTPFTKLPTGDSSLSNSPNKQQKENHNQCAACH